MQSRRRFLSTAGAALLAAPRALAMPPIERAEEATPRLSLAAYSFRDSFRYNRGAQQEARGRELDMLDFIDYCAEQGLHAAELTSYFFPPEVDRQYCLNIRRHAFLRGVSISGTAVGNRFTLPKGPERDLEIASVKRWIDCAEAMGAPHLRVFAGEIAEGQDRSAAFRNCVEALEDCCAYAAERGVLLGIENHGGIVARAEQLLEVVKAVRSPWFGISLDTGNFFTEDPYGDLVRCAPYAVNVQLKTEIGSSRERLQPADLPRLASILRDEGYRGYVALEYEEQGDPWTEVPATLARLKELFAR